MIQRLFRKKIAIFGIIIKNGRDNSAAVVPRKGVEKESKPIVDANVIYWSSSSHNS